MVPWEYKVTWDDGRTEAVTIRPGDQARMEAQMGRSTANLIQSKMWTTYCDMLIIHKALTRMKVEPVQTLDEFLDTADFELVTFGEAKGKARGRAASTG